MLDENHHLIQCILDYQSKGKTAECTQYQQILHRNLVYLATIADSNQNMQSLLPAPPTQNMNLGPGALSQSGSSQGLHSQGSLSDAIGAGLPPSSLMQGQIGNGPNHVSMQQTAQSTLPTTSMSMSGSGHGTGPGYSHSGPASQSVPLQGQGAIGNYVSRANINMQSNPVSMMHQQAASSHYNSAAQGGSQHYQGPSSMAMMGQSGQGGSMMGQRPLAPYRPSQQGSSQQYLGQEEYYGSEQYGHSQAASEPMGQQYYPEGHGDYAYPQSYTEQSYDRSFEESTQHYYEGGAMVPLRLLLGRPRTVFGGAGCWTRVGPGWLPRHSPPRPFSAGCVDFAKHQEPPGKKLLSEKKLTPASASGRRTPSFFSGGSPRTRQGPPHRPDAVVTRGVSWTSGGCSSEGVAAATA
uniref:SS18 N-terminal domain-containing protein n=1 Tax=Suricata suricatta TaxID=37032 RepID=A0A673VGW2_SURSU